MRRDDLTPKQRETVEATEPVVVALGGAGSGKTTTALWTGREHLLHAETPDSQRVLFTTFSRTAVGQIARRAGPVFAGVEGRIEIHTFHSLAYRLLRGFGRYAGYGMTLPQIESEARKKLLGTDRHLLSYDDLLPAAERVLRSRRVQALVGARWGLVICDEFQDTSTDQWGLLQRLGESARLLLLADPHQMIYTFIPTVSAQRLEEARSVAGRVVELEEASHRDPSGVIPAMARAVRDRRFDDPAITHAAAQGRLHVITTPGDDLPDRVVSEIRRLRREGCRAIGIFDTTNGSVAQLGAELTERGIEHVLIGLPEAHGEALLAMATIVAHGLGAVAFEGVRLQLAVFLTSATRTPAAPGLAEQLLHDAVRSANLRERLSELERAAREAEGAETLTAVATSAWEGLGMTTGRPAWRRAAAGFSALARQTMASRRLATEEVATELIEATGRLRTEALITEEPLRVPIQIMNFHQTKGREADAVILVYREGGFVTSWTHAEPFTVASRVLYVALTRARTQVTVMLPPNPHPLIAPFRRFA